MLVTPERKTEGLAPPEKEEKKTPGSAVSNKEMQMVSEFVALKKLNVQIRKGDFVCIIGDVGSGKSSLLSALIGDLLVLSSQRYQEIAEVQMNDDYATGTILDDSRKRIDEPPISITEQISYV